MLGYAHVTFGILAILFASIIFCITKGSQLHRILGYLYVANMLGLNITALMIYRVFGFFGPFHVLALLSMGTVVAGFVPAYFRRPTAKWLNRHYEWMCWSYVGLLAATAAEIVVRLPFIRSGLAFGIATFASSFVVVFLGAHVLYRFRDDVLAPFRMWTKERQPSGAVDSISRSPASPDASHAAELSSPKP
jgi:uncharacterized membrane protein